MSPPEPVGAGNGAGTHISRTPPAPTHIPGTALGTATQEELP
jgi:hypothetical protein